MDANLRSDPSVLEVARESTEIAAITSGFKVVSADGFTAAGGVLTRIKAALKRLEEARVRITGPLNEALRQVNAQAKESAQPLLESEARIKSALVAYNNEQERIRREEQRRADEAAERERRRLQEIADRAAAKGQAEKAEAFAERAQTTVAPVVNRAPPKVAGVSMRDVWRFEVTDASKVNAAFLVPDEAKIRKVVQSMRADAQDLVGAGVRIWCEKQVAAGAAS